MLCGSTNGKADETGKIAKAKARLVEKGSSRSMAWIILRLSRRLQMLIDSLDRSTGVQV